MPEKRSAGSLIAVGLVSFAAGLLISRRRCRCSSSDSSVQKWARLYLSHVPLSEDKQAINEEVKKITRQLQEMFIDKYNAHSRYRYTLGFITKEISGGQDRIIEVQFYTIRTYRTKEMQFPDKPDSTVRSEGMPDSNARSLDPDTAAAPQMMLSETSGELTDHTPPPCPRPRPRLMTRYEVEGWVCEY